MFGSTIQSEWISELQNVLTLQPHVLMPSNLNIYAYINGKHTLVMEGW